MGSLGKVDCVVMWNLEKKGRCRADQMLLLSMSLVYLRCRVGLSRVVCGGRLSRTTTAAIVCAANKAFQRSSYPPSGCPHDLPRFGPASPLGEGGCSY